MAAESKNDLGFLPSPTGFPENRILFFKKRVFWKNFDFLENWRVLEKNGGHFLIQQLKIRRNHPITDPGVRGGSEQSEQKHWRLASVIRLPSPILLKKQYCSIRQRTARQPYGAAQSRNA